MKNFKWSLFLIFLLFSMIGCDSFFSNEIEREPLAVDEDGDPIVVIDPTQESNDFGAINSYCYGYSLPADDFKATINTNINLPASIDLSNYLPEVRSQGKQGSCVAWATGYYMKSFQENFQNAMDGNLSEPLILSPAYIYNQIKISDCAGGSSIADALNLITTDGVTTWDAMPYDENSCNDQPDDLQKLLAENNKIQSHKYLDPEDLYLQAKAFLNNNQPIVVAISIDNNYFGALDENNNAIYRKFKKVDGAHAMLVVGYNDEMQAFKAVNSWGKSWGNDGFVWIDYKAFTDVLDENSDFKILCEAWVSQDVENNI